MQNDDHIQALQKAFRLSEDDLVYNREGRLSPTQRFRYLRGFIIYTLIGLPILAIAIRIVLGIQDGWLIQLFFFLLVAVFALAVLLNLVPMLQNVIVGKVKSEVDVIRLEKASELRGGVTWNVKINKHEFELSQKKFAALQNRAKYRVYMPAFRPMNDGMGQVIVAWEYISPSPPNTPDYYVNGIGYLQEAAKLAAIKDETEQQKKLAALLQRVPEDMAVPGEYDDEPEQKP